MADAIIKISPNKVGTGGTGGTGGTLVPDDDLKDPLPFIYPTMELLSLNAPNALETGIGL